MIADKYREIYNAFLNFGSILSSRTMKEISNANLFSEADSLLMLERKYADILNDEDMTGIHKEKKNPMLAMNNEPKHLDDLLLCSQSILHIALMNISSDFAV